MYQLVKFLTLADLQISLISEYKKFNKKISTYQGSCLWVLDHSIPLYNTPLLLNNRITWVTPLYSSCTFIIYYLYPPYHDCKEKWEKREAIFQVRGEMKIFILNSRLHGKICYLLYADEVFKGRCQAFLLKQLRVFNLLMKISLSNI